MIQRNSHQKHHHMLSPPQQNSYPYVQPTIPASPMAQAPQPMIESRNTTELQQLREENKRLLDMIRQRDNALEELKQIPDINQLERLRTEQAKHQAELLYEIESLRADLEDRQRPIMYNNNTKEIVELKGTIGILNEKAKILEEQLNKRNEEIKILLKRIADYEPNKITNQPNQDQEQRMHFILDKVEELTKRLEQKSEECEKLRQTVTYRDAEITEWRVKSASTDQLGVQLKLKIQYIHRGLESRILLLAQENDRLQGMLQQRNTDILNLKRQISDSNDRWSQQEERIAYLQTELKTKIYGQDRDLNRSELEQLRGQLKNKFEQVEILKYQNLRESNYEVRSLQDEVNRLNQIVTQQKMELDGYRYRLSDGEWGIKLQDQNKYDRVNSFA